MAKPRKAAVAYVAGRLTEVEAPDWWPGNVERWLGAFEDVPGTKQVSIGAIGGIEIWQHVETERWFARVHVASSGLKLNLLLPGDLDVARFWMDVVRPYDVAENYGVLGSSLGDHGAALKGLSLGEDVEQFDRANDRLSHLVERMEAAGRRNRW